MNIKLLLKVLLEVLFYVWLLFYGLSVLCYVIAVFSKIFNPDVNNLNWNEFAIFGIALLVLLIVTILALKRRAKKQKLKE